MVLVSKGKPKFYFSREKFVLRLFGISLRGNEGVLYNIYSFFALTFFNLAYPMVQSGDLFKYDIGVFAEIYVYVAGTYMGVLITAIVYRNRVKLGKLLDKLEKPPFIAKPERGGDAEEKLLRQWFSFTNKQSLAMYIGIIGSLGSQTIYTLIKRIMSSDYHDWVFSFGPITVLNVTYSPNYEISWLYQNISLFCIGFNMSSCTLILAGMLAFISVQLRMLQNNIKMMVQNGYTMMLKEKPYKKYSFMPKAVVDPSIIPWNFLQTALKEAVEYHLSIIGITRELEEIFSMAMLSLYLFTLSILCCEVFRSSLLPIDDIRTARLLLEATTVSFQTLIICYWGEQVTHESEKVGKAAYESYLVGTDLKFQKGLIIIIRRSQNPIRLKAGKFIETSLTTFAWIQRTSYSAFTMLRNVNQKE